MAQTTPLSYSSSSAFEGQGEEVNGKTSFTSSSFPDSTEMSLEGLLKKMMDYGVEYLKLEASQLRLHTSTSIKKVVAGFFMGVFGAISLALSLSIALAFIFYGGAHALSSLLKMETWGGYLIAGTLYLVIALAALKIFARSPVKKHHKEFNHESPIRK